MSFVLCCVVSCLIALSGHTNTHTHSTPLSNPPHPSNFHVHVRPFCAQVLLAFVHNNCVCQTRWHEGAFFISACSTLQCTFLYILDYKYTRSACVMWLYSHFIFNWGNGKTQFNLISQIFFYSSNCNYVAFFIITQTMLANWNYNYISIRLIMSWRWRIWDHRTNYRI